MNLLIAYDGSQCADAAIDDLTQSGLPETGEALVISVAEVWLPSPESSEEFEAENEKSDFIEEIVRARRAKNEKLLDASSELADLALARVRVALPGWTVTSYATYGSPAWEILATSDQFGADLIVVGSHGQSALSRFFLGSISQKVLTEARCSVRVARGRNEVDPAPARIVVGFDGSRGSMAAVDAVARRNWNKGTEVRLVTATEEITPGVFTRFVPPVVRMVEDANIAEQHWIAQLAEPAIEKLMQAGIETSIHLHSGNPRDVVVNEAEQWSADCIFVGATAHEGALERALLGSTSGAVAARAHCSVEIVRLRPQKIVPSNGKTGNGTRR